MGAQPRHRPADLGGFCFRNTGDPHCPPVRDKCHGVIDDVRLRARAGISHSTAHEVFDSRSDPHTPEPCDGHLVTGPEDQLGVCALSGVGQERSHEVQPLW